MDYEKKYNEALERARKIHSEIVNNEIIGFPGQIEDIFPELRESEDERIRKGLIKLLTVASEAYLVKSTGIKKDSYLSYLEKQKEPKHAPDDLQKSFEAGQKSIVDNPEQYGLCKKIEWSEEDERILKGIIGKIDHDQTYGVSKKDMLNFLKRRTRNE